MKKTQGRNEQQHHHHHQQDDHHPHPLPPRNNTYNDDDDDTSSTHRQFLAHNQLHGIGYVGQRFLRHFDYTFLLARSINMDGSGVAASRGSGLSPAAEAYLRHYYTQHQPQQPLLRRRTTVDGSSRNSGRRTGVPPLVPLENSSLRLLPTGGGSPLVDMRDFELEDVERLARSFVFVEGDSNEEYVRREDEGHEQQPPPSRQRPRLLRQCSSSSIHHNADAGKNDTNHAECIDTISTTATTRTTDSNNNSNSSSGKSRWGAFSLLPIMPHRPSITTTTTVNFMSEEDVREAVFVASTTATLPTTADTSLLSTSSTTTTTTATLVYCDSADEDDEQLQQYLPGQQIQHQQWYDHMAIPSSNTGDNNNNNNNNKTNNRGMPIVRDNPILSHHPTLPQEPSRLPPPPSGSLTSTTNFQNTDASNSNCKGTDKTSLAKLSNTSTSSIPRQERVSTMYHHHNQLQHTQRTMLSFAPPPDNHPQPQQQKHSGRAPALAPSESTAARQGTRMQRFTRLEDLADLEDLPVRLPATTLTSNNSNLTRVTSANSHIHRPSESGEHNDNHFDTHQLENELVHEHRREQDERTRQYIEAHTTFLNSADTEGSGYIPPRPSAPASIYSHQHPHYHDQLDDHSHASVSTSASRTPIHYPSSLAEDEGHTAPGTPHSFLSSPSLGYYSHPSRPPSQTGYWLDQGASSLNLIMPSSAMFVKSRESTAEGDKLGFVKFMVAGQSRVWNSRLIQEMFRWDGIIANDFDDDFLQDPLLPESDSSGGIAATALANSGSEPDVHHGGLAGSGGASSNESSSFLEETPGQSQRKREYNSHNQAGVREAIVEHYASSMVLPAWARAGFEDQELHQEILVKNICIVDTPGYSAFNNPTRAMDLVISYLGLQFQTTNEFFSRSAVSDDSLGRFLANNTTGAHSHVDACLYVIEGHLSEIDIQFMLRLQPWVNLIPVLIPPNVLQEREQGETPQGQEDVIMSTPTTTTADTIARARLDLIRQLKEHEIHIYGIDLDSAVGGHHNPAISISSNSSPYTTAESPEADLASPPLLVLDGSGPLSPEFTSPPFIFHVPPSLMEDTGVGQLDKDVLHLDVVTKQNSINCQQDEDYDDNDGLSTLLPTVPQHRASSALGVQEDLPDLGPLRHWVYVRHLAALRHHTTQKFLTWRRQLLSMHVQSPMESSQDSGSYRQQHRRQHHHAHGGQQHQQSSINSFSSDSAGSGSYRPTLASATHSPPSSASITQHQHGLNQQQLYHNQRALPTDLLGDLRAQDQKRISDKVVRMLETQGQVFDRILQERQAAWRQALEGMEREQRIEFLMHELRRWANDGPCSKEQSRNLREGDHRGQKHRRLDVQYREGPNESDRSGAGGGAAVGSGVEAMGAVGEPSLRDALFTEAYGVEVSNSVRSTTANISDRKSRRSKHAGGGGRDRSGTKKNRSSSKLSPIPTSSYDQDAEMKGSREEEEVEEEDPLGLGLWMSRLFGAIGRGLVQIVVMVGMGSFATWIYTHFLEHRVTWIG